MKPEEPSSVADNEQVRHRVVSAFVRQCRMIRADGSATGDLVSLVDKNAHALHNLLSALSEDISTRLDPVRWTWRQELGFMGVALKALFTGKDAGEAVIQRIHPALADSIHTYWSSIEKILKEDAVLLPADRKEAVRGLLSDLEAHSLLVAGIKPNT